MNYREEKKVKLWDQRMHLVISDALASFTHNFTHIMHVNLRKYSFQVLMPYCGTGITLPSSITTRASSTPRRTIQCPFSPCCVSFSKPSSSTFASPLSQKKRYIDIRNPIAPCVALQAFERKDSVHISEGRAMGVFLSKASLDDNQGDTGLIEAPYLIVGLGNPGLKYKKNRHNVGFMAIEELGAAHNISFGRLQKNCDVGRGYIHDKKVILAKPMTFMNNSGEGVSKLLKVYDVPLDRLIVLTDDLDTPPGKVRLKQRGGHGGQNGIRSIIDLVKSKEFARVKIGIGRPAPGDDVVSHVLSDFSGTEDAQNALHSQLKEAVNIVEAILLLGMEKALSGVRIGSHSSDAKRKREDGTEEEAKRLETSTSRSPLP